MVQIFSGTAVTSAVSMNLSIVNVDTLALGAKTYGLDFVDLFTVPDISKTYDLNRLNPKAATKYYDAQLTLGNGQAFTPLMVAPGDPSVVVLQNISSGTVVSSLANLQTGTSAQFAVPPGCTFVQMTTEREFTGNGSILCVLDQSPAGTGSTFNLLTVGT